MVICIREVCAELFEVRIRIYIFYIRIYNSLYIIYMTYGYG